MNYLLDQAFAQLIPIILTVLSTILTTVLVRGSTLIKQRWGVEIEEKHRDALHSAIMSGLRSALQRGEKDDEAISSAITYAHESVPDAIKALKPASTVLSSIATAKLREVSDFVTEKIAER